MNKPIEKSASSGSNKTSDQLQKPVANTITVPSEKPLGFSEDKKPMVQGAPDKDAAKAAVTEPAAK